MSFCQISLLQSAICQLVIPQGEIQVALPKVSRSEMIWAINETQSMKQAARLLGLAYNTFKKYAKMWNLWQPKSGKGVSKRGTLWRKPLELEEIFAGKSPNYSNTKLLHNLFREKYFKEECCNCGYDTYRASDMSKPLLLDYLDDDSTNKELTNLRVLCFNCFYVMKGMRLKVKTPKNVRQFKNAVADLFSPAPNESKLVQMSQTNSQPNESEE